MAKYSIEGQIADPSGGLAVLGLQQDGTTFRRGKIYDWMIGSDEGTPADNRYLWAMDRGTTGLGTSTPVTPSPLDPADAAALLDAGDAYTVNPTIGVRLLSLPQNERATIRWVAAPGSELVLAATTLLSIVARLQTATARAVATTILFEEQ